MSIPRWRKYVTKIIASEISSFSRYFDQLIQMNILKHDGGFLFHAVECHQKIQLLDEDELPDLSQQKKQRTLILFNGTFNHIYDIQELLTHLKPQLSRSTRIVAVTYNPYYKWLYWLANRLGIRKPELPFTFITRTDLHNLSKLSGFDVVKLRPIIFFPFEWKGIGTFINRLFPTLPFFRNLGLVNIIVLRAIIPEKEHPSLSVVIPARNEEGNIENALKRMPRLDGVDLEIIFVEGHSTDRTWDEILRVKKQYSSQFNIKAFQQTGKGKGDAVRLGFSHATRDLLTILDADLTMPPEQLGRFCEAYCMGLADFINGSRSVYPMEDNAMRFLNTLGNVFFAKALSYILETKLTDSLCGTKLLSAHDYQRFLSWREDFGDFDPFGDYELLFPAAIIPLSIIDIPIRYMNRTYGSTNINRFRHGLMLFKMVWMGFFRVKMGRIR